MALVRPPKKLSRGSSMSCKSNLEINCCNLVFFSQLISKLVLPYYHQTVSKLFEFSLAFWSFWKVHLTSGLSHQSVFVGVWHQIDPVESNPDIRGTQNLTKTHIRCKTCFQHRIRLRPPPPLLGEKEGQIQYQTLLTSKISHHKIRRWCLSLKDSLQSHHIGNWCQVHGIFPQWEHGGCE